jgi:hypothetical protein
MASAGSVTISGVASKHSTRRGAMGQTRAIAEGKSWADGSGRKSSDLSMTKI